MKKLMIAVCMFFTSIASNVYADGHGNIKMGIILGFTGPIESLTPAMAASAELAFNEASDLSLIHISEPTIQATI